ncbi:DUF2779 domain-containing protein [Candidatus Woesearchaeota archaeon]|nr:DUF2779 domain-containing protein [Candidatus Woesearchaeota archaeon]
MTQITLTKSLYVTGVFCPRLFWMKLNRPRLLPETGIDGELRMAEGQVVGEMATSMWPDGIMLRNYDQEANAAKTKELLASGKRVPLFEAGFAAVVEDTPCFARVDILVPVGKDSWDLYEVKSSTRVKDEHLHDVAFQARVLTQNGLHLNRIHIVHINSDYIRGPQTQPIDVAAFLEVEDVTDRLAPVYDDAEHFIPFLKDLLTQKQYPETICEKPRDCDACSQVLPAHSVFELVSLRNQKAKALWGNGYKLIEKIPRETKLSRKQALQSVAVMTGQAHLEEDVINEFLSSLTFPLHHVDFETFNTGIPKYEGTKPYQQIPFQYSLIIQQNNGETKHVEFIAEPELDPRPAFLASLKAALANTSGTILAFNAPFEIRILQELMKAYPEHEAWITDVLSRFKDLAEPFRSFAYYHPDQHGSYSIKALLPVLTNTSYEGMDIAGGGVASASFLALDNATDEDAQAIRTALLAYCKQDTQSMIDVLDALKKLS